MGITPIEMDKPDIKFKSKSDPLVAFLPDHLKNPANYEDIQKKILATLKTKCSHSDMLEMSKCQKCTDMMIRRRKLLKELGFKNPAQYMQWRKIHEKIKEKFPLVDWAKVGALSNLIK